MAILLITLTFLFLSFSLGQLARVEIVSGIAFTALDVTVGTLVIGWILRNVIKKQWVNSINWKSFGTFICLAFVSLLMHIAAIPYQQALGAVLYFFRYIVYSLVFFAFLSFSPTQKQITKILMSIGGFLLVVIGYVQYFFYPSLRNLFYAGWDEHLFRMFGSFLDPNYLGLFFVLFVLFIGYQLYSAQNTKLKWLYGVLLLITVSAVFFTYSRTAFIALISGSITMPFVMGSKKKAGIFLALILIGGLLTFFVTGKRSEGTNVLRVVSTEARFNSAKEALTIWQKNLLFGVGFNSYRYARHQYGFVKANGDESHAGAGADNSFLFVGATTGIVGFVAFLYFLLSHVSAVLRQKDKALAGLGLSTIVALCVGSLFINGLFYPSILLWLWMILAITESK